MGVHLCRRQGARECLIWGQRLEAGSPAASGGETAPSWSGVSPPAQVRLGPLHRDMGCPSPSLVLWGLRSQACGQWVSVCPDALATLLRRSGGSESGGLLFVFRSYQAGSEQLL